MGKDIGQIYEHGQSQISTLSLKTPFSSSSDPQTPSAIELTTTSIPSVTNKHQKNSDFYYQNTIQNDATITKNDDIQSCETQFYFFNITTISTPNHHSQRISSTSSSTLTSNTPTILPPIGKGYMSF